MHSQRERICRIRPHQRERLAAIDVHAETTGRLPSLGPAALRALTVETGLLVAPCWRSVCSHGFGPTDWSLGNEITVHLALGRIAEMSLTTDIGRRIELVSMDSHFQEISIGLYRQPGAQGPEFLVHTYSGLDGARERVESATRTMVVLGGMEAVEGDSRRVKFACNRSHDFACRRVFLESCKWDPALAVEPKPLTIFDKKSDANVTVSSLAGGAYRVTGEDSSDREKKRRDAIGAGLVKLGEMEWAEGDEELFAFPCGHSHDKLVGLLLIRALNVRGVERERQMALARGQLLAPSAQKQ